jgi:hypothetical protein
MTDCGLDLVVKEQGGAKQMLVCYESILAGESRALSSSVFHNWEVKVPALSQRTRQERGTAGVLVERVGQPPFPFVEKSALPFVEIEPASRRRNGTLENACG